MRRLRRARIVATIGPASSSPEMILKLAETGVDVFRLNFSHGVADDHRATMNGVRAAEEALGRPLAALADLQGPKLRVGVFKGDRLRLEQGETFRFDLDTALGGPQRVNLPHPEIFAGLRVGADILVDDGRMRFRVRDCGPDFAVTETIVPGEISNRKGVNVPDVVLPIPALTAKDHADLAVALEIGADWIAQSFVQRPEDSAELKKLVGGRAAVMAKLEKPSAIERLEEILDYVDGVMVARGDLGVEMPPEDVPVLQKRIVRAARERGRPVIVATQMLDSMVHSPTPTRAEASDVATAIYDGADAVMLSAESAVGDHPLAAVAMMNRIIARVETSSMYPRLINADHPEPDATVADALTAAARVAVDTIGADAIVTYTTSGWTALRMARERPAAPVVAITPSLSTARRLSATWGVHAVVTEDARDVEDMVTKASQVAKDEHFTNPGGKLIILAGIPFGVGGTTNLMRVTYVT